MKDKVTIIMTDKIFIDFEQVINLYLNDRNNTIYKKGKDNKKVFEDFNYTLSKELKEVKLRLKLENSTLFYNALNRYDINLNTYKDNNSNKYIVFDCDEDMLIEAFSKYEEFKKIQNNRNQINMIKMKRNIKEKALQKEQQNQNQGNIIYIKDEKR